MCRICMRHICHPLGAIKKQEKKLVKLTSIFKYMKLIVNDKFHTYLYTINKSPCFIHGQLYTKIKLLKSYIYANTLTYIYLKSLKSNWHLWLLLLHTFMKAASFIHQLFIIQFYLNHHYPKY